MKKGIHPENYRPVVFKDMLFHRFYFRTLSMYGETHS